MKDVAFTCPITQEYVHDLLNETFDYQNITVFKGKDEKYNWIYMIINKKNGHFFIGTRSKSNLLNSINIARHPELKADVERLGADAFSRFDLCYYQTYEEMMAVAADQFGDEFISVFSELGTCYNAISIQADEEVKTDEDIKADETVKADEDIKADENMLSRLNRQFCGRYRHTMKKDGIYVQVPNTECLSFLQKGYKFAGTSVDIYRPTDLKRRHITIHAEKDYDGLHHASYENRRNYTIQLLLQSGWLLSSREITEKINQKMKKKETSQQLPLDFPKPDDQSKSSKPINKSNKKSSHIVLKKDDKFEAVCIDEIQLYLAKGYVFLTRLIVLIKDDKKRHIIFKSNSKDPLLSDDDYAKTRSMEVLNLLENGWKILRK